MCSADVKRFYVRWSHKQCKPRSRNLLERPSVNSEDLKPNKILIGPLFSEPVQVIVTIPMGPAVIYIGHTEDLAQRWIEHLTGRGADWTKFHGVRHVLHYEQMSNREAGVELERKWKSGTGREFLKTKTRTGHLPAGRQVDVRFIEVKGRSDIGDIALTTNEYNTAKRFKKDYYLYIVLHCASTPSLNIFQDPATLDWQPIVKVEHYRLKQDSIKHPVELKDDAVPYRSGVNQ